MKLQKPPIVIKPSHRGALHQWLGEKPGTKLTHHQLLMAKGSESPKVRKMANFAINSASWNKK